MTQVKLELSYLYVNPKWLEKAVDNILSRQIFGLCFFSPGKQGVVIKLDFKE